MSDHQLAAVENEVADKPVQETGDCRLELGGFLLHLLHGLSKRDALQVREGEGSRTWDVLYLLHAQAISLCED